MEISDQQETLEKLASANSLYILQSIPIKLLLDKASFYLESVEKFLSFVMFSFVGQ